MSGSAGNPVVLHAPEPDDLAWVVRCHGELYASEYRWDRSFESLVATIIGEFRGATDDSGQRGWIARVSGRRAGCVFLMRESEAVGKLRLLLVEPWARRHGVGRRLVHACTETARRSGYRTLTLWTMDVLIDARRLYERAGFRLVESQPQHRFGKALVSETWELAL